MPAPNDTLDENQNIELNYDDWINYPACFSFIALCLLFYFNFHRSFLFFKTCLRAGVSIHDKLFCGITRASMNFFECTSTEQILELFTTATATVDVELPLLFHDFFVVRMFFRGIFKISCVFHLSRSFHWSFLQSLLSFSLLLTTGSCCRHFSCCFSSSDTDVLSLKCHVISSKLNQ